MRVDVLIIGAGIAGLSLAAGLERLGLSYLIVEKRAHAGALGAGILMHPSGLAALSFLGVDLMKAADFHIIDAIHLSSPRNTAVARQVVGDDLYPVIGMQRAQLHRVLMSSIKPGAIKCGCRVTRIHQASRQSTVNLSDGTVLMPQLIVAADGANSGMRKYAERSERLNTSTQVVWRWLVDRVIAPATAHEVHGGQWRLGAFPIGSRQSCVFLTAGGLRLSAAKQLQSADLQVKTRALGDVGMAVADVPMTAPPLLHAIFETPLRWCNDDGVVFIGDAAHTLTPNLGIGGSLALEDSAVLVAAIANGSCTSAVAEAALRTRSTRIRNLAIQSRFLGYSAHVKSPRVTDLKLRALGVVPPRISRFMQNKLYAGFYRALPVNSACWP